MLADTFNIFVVKSEMEKVDHCMPTVHVGIDLKNLKVVIL